MKRMAYFLTMVLMLPLFVACSNDTEEELLLPQETPSAVKGTETREADERPYWWLWANSQKLYFTYLDTKAFIYYHPSDREVIVQKLAERGLKLEDDYDYSLFDNPETYTNKGEKLDFLCECVWNEVSGSYKDIIDIPEILDACPNIRYEAGSVSSGASVISLYTTNPDVVQEITDEYKVNIIGSQTYEHFAISYVVCDKNSKGNAFEIAKNIWEKYHVGAEPAFTDAKAC